MLTLVPPEASPNLRRQGCLQVRPLRPRPSLPHSRIYRSSISHHRYDPIFATASTSIEIWDETKTSPLSTLKFHSTSALSTGEHIVSVAFNKSETSILASSGSDRTVCLYDLRSGKAVGRVALNVRWIVAFFLSSH